ncbi:hypothetical protein LP421_14965 [Rhizobium sp. RCAM05350]|nr:hypothetical protein LP421_14965 [Rhizobium sp. RCAM05350]
MRKIALVVLGKPIYLVAPMGGGFPPNDHPSGEVGGSGKALRTLETDDPT